MAVAETARLSLRRFVRADAGRLYVLNSDPEVMRFIGDGRPSARLMVRRGFAVAGLARVVAITHPDNKALFGAFNSGT